MEAATVVLRLALYLDLMLLFGIAAFALYGLRERSRRFGAPLALSPMLIGGAALGAVLSALSLAAMAAAMAGVSMAEVDRETLVMLLGETSVGTAWIFRMAALGVTVAAAFFGRRYPGPALWTAAAAGAVALATLAWSGHGAMDEGAVGWLHLGSDILHLLAAGVWLGALFALSLLVFRRAAAMDRSQLMLAHDALAGFSATGSLVVGAILLTGLINGWMIVGPDNLLTLPTTLYGQLLIAKLLLFAAMLGLAWSNRFRLVPAFATAIAGDDHQRALLALRRSLAIESGCAITVLALVAWLGTLDPLG